MVIDIIMATQLNQMANQIMNWLAAWPALKKNFFLRRREEGGGGGGGGEEGGGREGGR